MTEKEIIRIVETLKNSRNILLGHKIEVLWNDREWLLHVKLWKNVIQEFGATLLHIKGEANVVINDFIRIPMVYHAHKLADTTLEEDTCENMCLDLLFISDNTDCFSLEIEEISFSLAHQVLEAEQNL